MSLSKNIKLVQVATKLCRELRKNQTNEEKIFWERIRNRKFLGRKFYRQYPIFYDELGEESFYIADFFCFEEKLVVEIDGELHNHQKEKDLLRDDVVKSLGMKVIRFKNDELEKSIDDV